MNVLWSPESPQWHSAFPWSLKSFGQTTQSGIWSCNRKWNGSKLQSSQFSWSSWSLCETQLWSSLYKTQGGKIPDTKTAELSHAQTKGEGEKASMHTVLQSLLQKLWVCHRVHPPLCRLRSLPSSLYQLWTLKQKHRIDKRGAKRYFTGENI